MKEFKIKALPELDFRIMKISPIDLLALMGQLDINDFEHTKTLYTFALEHTEVKQGEKWFTVKYPGKEIYTPTTIEENPIALYEISEVFIAEVITKNFTNSRE